MAVSAARCVADMGPPVASHKKIIGWGTDTLDEIYLSEHVEEIEQRLPIDGVVVSLYPDGWTGSRRHRNRQWFGGAKYAVSDFSEGIARLKGCRFTRLTDNFLDFATSARPTSRKGGRIAEWFDDEHWENVALASAATAAKIAHEIGFKGLFIDTEAYRSRPFSYGPEAQECEPPRSLEDCRAQLHKRGRQFGEAVTAVYPDIVLFFIAGLGLCAADQDLLMPFLDGVLEGAGPEVAIHDGGESGYPRMLYSSFRQLRDSAAAKGKETSAVPALFEKRMQFGFGVWVDCRPNVYGGFHTDDLARNHRDGPALEHTLYNALSVADRYVWLYVWHPKLWWTPSKGRDKMCVLCPHERVPKPYIDAIAACRTPHELAWTPLTRDAVAYGPASEWPGHGREAVFADFAADYELVRDLSRDTWRFLLDAELPFGYSSLEVDESLFAPVGIGEFWENQGYPFNGIGWYRLWVTVPETLNGRSLANRKFLLVYGGVAGSTCTWIWRRQLDADDGIRGYPHGHAGLTHSGSKWNMVELARENLGDYEQSNMARRFERDVTMIVRPGQRHLIVVRVHNTKGPGGIWRPIKLYVAK